MVNADIWGSQDEIRADMELYPHFQLYIVTLVASLLVMCFLQNNTARSGAFPVTSLPAQVLLGYMSDLTWNTMRHLKHAKPPL